MKKYLLTVLLAGFLHNAVKAQQIVMQTVPPEANAFYNKAMPIARTEIKSWVLKTAVQTKNKQVDESVLRADAKAQFPDLKTMDIDALIVLVMVKSANDEQADLKEQMEELKKINDQKAKQRQATTAAKKEVKKDSLYRTPTTGYVKTPTALRKDSLGSNSEITAMQLQNSMDRRSKTIESISNIMKKISSTQDKIIQNLK